MMIAENAFLSLPHIYAFNKIKSARLHVPRQGPTSSSLEDNGVV